jgi:hypothetical protein
MLKELGSSCSADVLYLWDKEFTAVIWGYYSIFSKEKIKGKVIPETDHGGPEVYETTRLPYFPDSRLTDGGEFVNLMSRPPFTPQEDSWYSFLLEAESIPGP